MRLIDADKLLTDKMKSKYYHLPNGDIAIPLIDIEHAPTIDAVEVVKQENNTPKGKWSEDCKCTICGFGDEDFGLSQIIRCNFCPNCGARMI